MKPTKKKGNLMSELEIKKEIFALSFHYDTEKHKMKMRELAYIRETNRIRHQEELERQRIK